MRLQGKPWDLMAWGFSTKWEEGCASIKSAIQLKQEAAMVLCLGGGFQTYFKQKRDLSIYDWNMDIMGEVAEFCRARQEFCHRAQTVPQVALLYSRESLYRTNSKLFGPWANEALVPLNGVLRCLLDSQYSVDILVEHHFEQGISQYPLVVVPEWPYLGEDFKSLLLNYVEEGGNLLLVGPRSTALFEKQLGVSLKGTPQEKSQWLEHNGRLAGMKTLSQSVEVGAQAQPLGRIFAKRDIKGDSETAASVAALGKGKIAATYINLGERYCTARTSRAREFLKALVQQLFPEPMVEVKGSHYVDVVVNRINGRLAVNLVNTAGPHHDKDIYVFDEIPTLGPLEIIIRQQAKPKNVVLQPEGIQLKFDYQDGVISLNLPLLKIHSIIMVD
jgi:hypothetical protein